MQGNLDTANEESVQVQLEEMLRLSQIIDELLFLSRAETHDLRLNRTAHYPQVLLAKFDQDARALAEHRSLQYLYSHPGVIKSTHQCLECVAIRRSYCSALEYRCGSLAGRAQRRRAGDRGGISRADFRTFFRLSTTDGLEDEGSGLGLAICRSIVALHGGKIWAEAAEGNTGLRMVFEIPVATARPPGVQN